MFQGLTAVRKFGNDLQVSQKMETVVCTL